MVQRPLQHLIMTIQTQQYYIGWDVGGWNCDKNSSSRDAIVILDEEREIVGTPWRGNLRKEINAASTTGEWLAALFTNCRATLPDGPVAVIMAIDTPLGFSEPFVRLVSQRRPAGPVEQSATNPYLYRQTEMFLINNVRQPLSAVKDMIGSQATKGMHVLARFASNVESCGVWGDGQGFRAIEAYPSACETSELVERLVAGRTLKHKDLDDALKCALIAYLFVNDPDSLIHPLVDIPESEGWIWVPKLPKKEH